jgi:hypothetical protein
MHKPSPEHQRVDEIKEVNLIELSNRSSSYKITDTLCQGVHHKVSVEPTLHDMGLVMFRTTQFQLIQICPASEKNRN